MKKLFLLFFPCVLFSCNDNIVDTQTTMNDSKILLSENEILSISNDNPRNLTEDEVLLKSYDLYFHANMGWGGTDNGYYKVNADTSTDFETTLGTYNLNFWEITEIHKK